MHVFQIVGKFRDRRANSYKISGLVFKTIREPKESQFCVKDDQMVLTAMWIIKLFLNCEILKIYTYSLIQIYTLIQINLYLHFEI